MQKSSTSRLGAFSSSANSSVDCRRVVPSNSSTSEKQSFFPNNDKIDLSALTPLESSWVQIRALSSERAAVAGGQSVEYDKSTKSIYCSYGKSAADGNFSDEIWRYSVCDNTWERFEVGGLVPRANCGSVLFGNKLWFFGGLNQANVPAKDLHYIDLEKKVVVYPKTSGPEPPPCANPLTMCFKPYIIVIANRSISDPVSIYLLNTDSMEWSMIKTEYLFRQGACGAVLGSKLYIFGLSVPKTILEMNLLDFSLNVLPTTGIEPVALDDLSAVALGTSLLLFFEKIGNESKSRMFVLDCERKNWYCYSLNYNKTHIIEGSPESVFYVEEERRLIAVWSNLDSKYSLTELHIGKSLSMINQKLDFLKMLE